MRVLLIEDDSAAAHEPTWAPWSAVVTESLTANRKFPSAQMPAPSGVVNCAISTRHDLPDLKTMLRPPGRAARHIPAWPQAERAAGLHRASQYR